MDAGTYERIAWRPTLNLKSLLFGLIIGLGLAVLTQQLGWLPFETRTLILLLIVGVLLGGGLASIGYAVGVARVDRALDRAEDDPVEGASEAPEPPEVDR